MTDQPSQSVPPPEPTGPSPATDAIRRKTVRWTWCSRIVLVAVLLLPVSELFVFRGRIFRWLTPALVMAQQPGNQPTEPGQPVPFDPTNFDTVPMTGTAATLAWSEQRKIAVRLERLSGELGRLESRESSVRERAQALGGDGVREALWDRVVDGTLKNEDTPAYWCNNSGSEWFFGYAIGVPLNTVKGRILCGAASTFDETYLNLLEDWIRNRTAMVNGWESKLMTLAQKLREEGITR